MWWCIPDVTMSKHNEREFYSTYVAMRPSLCNVESHQNDGLASNRCEEKGSCRDLDLSDLPAPFHFVRCCVMTPLFTPVPVSHKLVGVFYWPIVSILSGGLLNEFELIQMYDAVLWSVHLLMEAEVRSFDDRWHDFYSNIPHSALDLASFFNIFTDHEESITWLPVEMSADTWYIVVVKCWEFSPRVGLDW